MTTETKPTNSATDNKAVFGPLGKYAVIAVIMVSIIVTTAIMLDKQLNSAEEQIAAIESEVAEMAHASSSDSDTSDTAETAEAISASDTVEVTVQTDVVAETEVTTASTEVTAVTPALEVTAQTEVEATPAIAVESTVAAETITAEVVAEVQIEEVSFTMVDQNQQRQARIDTFKAEQKQRMADMFARIKALEAKQLDQYKVNQEKQIARLHDQVARQEKMIEALVLRNKDLYELRAANVQRIQTNREDVLNRI